MSFLGTIADNLINHFNNPELHPATIIAMLLMVAGLSIYEFVIYHVVLHRSLYNKAYNICIALIPFFISTIILCLQSNLIMTLGTIGALAIIRFRTAVKDPVDMIFLLWAIHIGIVCGCQLYELAVIVSIIATVVLIILNMITVGKKSHILIVHTSSAEVNEGIVALLKDKTTNYRVKSRNYTNKGINYVYEIMTNEADVITVKISELDGVERFSLMEYDVDDIL